MLDRVYAVVTSFRPDESLLRVVENLLPQTAGVIIVDDGSGPEVAALLQSVGRMGAHVIERPDNAGIAAALNTGLALAFESGADAVVTFDQDSHVPASFVNSLVSLHDELTRDDVLSGPIVPEYFAQVRQADRSDASGRLLATNAIQSGMLIARDLVAAIGAFDEGLFIDLVDTDFELRCLTAQRPVRAVPGLRLGHRLGTRYKVQRGIARLLPGAVTLSTPFRYYYRVRNRLVLERRYLRRHRKRLFRDGITDRLHFALVLLLARPRRTMWTLMRSGARAAASGASGRMPDEMARISRTITWSAEQVYEAD